MDAEMLYKYRAMEREIADATEEILTMQSMLTGIKAQTISDMPKAAPFGDVMLETIAKIQDMMNEREIKIKERVQMLDVILANLERLPENERRVLKYRFVIGWRYERIAELMKFDVRSIYRIRRKAISLWEKL